MISVKMELVITPLISSIFFVFLAKIKKYIKLTHINTRVAKKKVFRYLKP